MIEKLQVENYRSFQSYSMGGLKRVNLLTGYNNSGKTSLLEAVELLNSSPVPSAMATISLRRGELLGRDTDRTAHRREWVDFSSFFPGHQWIVGNTFRLNGNYVDATDYSKTINVSVINEDIEMKGRPATDPLRYSQIAKVEVNVKRSTGDATELSLAHPDELRMLDGRRYPRTGSSQSYPLRVITPDSLAPSEMSELWNIVVEERRERLVAQSLGMLDESIEDVAFLVSDGFLRSQRAGVLLGYKNSRRRQPMGSAGEGIRRMLALSLALATVSSGTLIVDEIDTGLHYSVLADMWKLVIATAIKNDIQVFATTHSLDCLRGLNEACERNPEFASEISLQTIDRNLDVSIAGDAENLRSAMDMGIEIR